jgi:hypothetical protein
MTTQPVGWSRESYATLLEALRKLEPAEQHPSIPGKFWEWTRDDALRAIDEMRRLYPRRRLRVADASSKAIVVERTPDDAVPRDPLGIRGLGVGEFTTVGGARLLRVQDRVYRTVERAKRETGGVYEWDMYEPSQRQLGHELHDERYVLIERLG